MGQHYEQVSSHTQDELRGGTKLVPVRVVAATTKPSGIYFEARLDLNAIDVTQIGPILEVTAQNLEIVAGRADVLAVEYAQDVNQAGQLIDTITVTVVSTSGLSTESMEYPLDWVVALGAGTVATATRSGKNPLTGQTALSIPEIRAQLDEIENL